MKYITTPIYYVNDKPHIGHAVTTIAADVLARFWRLRGQEVFFLTGTDEHGAKIAEAAEKAGIEPQLFVDHIAHEFESTWRELAIEPDGFIRTSDPRHEAVVKEFLQNLYDKGAIYKGGYKGWYCVGCEEFKTESQIGPDNTCLIHLRPLIEVEEEAYLFKLSTYSDQIKQLVESDTLKIRPESRKNEVLGFITHEGLRDVAISRKSVSWGIPLPWDESHTVYVWIDALLNYLSAAQENGPAFASGSRPEFPPTIQLIGKDILRFHAIIWPALLLAADKPLPKELLVHGYFTVNGQKMSKSLGNVITPQELIDRYGIDAARYLLLAVIPFGADGDISLDRLDALYTSDLANTFGNLVNRVQSMIERYRNRVVPKAEVENLGVATLVNAHFGSTIEPFIAHLNRLNSYIDQSKPWTLAKLETTEAQEQLNTVLATLAENVFIASVRISPLLPESSTKIVSLFGSSIDEIDYDTLLTRNHTSGKTITPIEPLFPRLES